MTDTSSCAGQKVLVVRGGPTLTFVFVLFFFFFFVVVVFLMKVETIHNSLKLGHYRPGSETWADDGPTLNASSVAL